MRALPARVAGYAPGDAATLAAAPANMEEEKKELDAGADQDAGDVATKKSYILMMRLLPALDSLQRAAPLPTDASVAAVGDALWALQTIGSKRTEVDGSGRIPTH
eukprot:GAFH01002878.1.p3 GENE.GAFH01002878.1~~GAFH01002878.1.p3  ORF type:complete len:105 (-),score=22.41 GAFH01002878.1:156-470(-)